MRRFSLLALTGTVISGMSLVAFSLISASALASFRYLVALCYVLANVGLFLWAARFLSVYWLVSLGCAIAVLSTTLDQMIGFWFLRGLVKDLDPFEWPHLQRLASMFLVLFCWYSVIAVLATLMARLVLRTRQPIS